MRFGVVWETTCRRQRREAILGFKNVIVFAFLSKQYTDDWSSNVPNMLSSDEGHLRNYPSLRIARQLIIRAKEMQAAGTCRVDKHKYPESTQSTQYCCSIADR